MKRLIAAAVLLVFVITVYFIGYFYTINTCNKAEEMLKNCISEYKITSNAYDIAKKLKDYWSKEEGKLSIFANHSDIDEIELAINSLIVYSKSKDESFFYEYSEKTKALLHQLIEDVKPSLHSII